MPEDFDVIVIGSGADETYVKHVGFADFYFGTKRYRHKLGLIQSLPSGSHVSTAQRAELCPGS